MTTTTPEPDDPIGLLHDVADAAFSLGDDITNRVKELEHSVAWIIHDRKRESDAHDDAQAELRKQIAWLGAFADLAGRRLKLPDPTPLAVSDAEEDEEMDSDRRVREAMALERALLGDPLADTPSPPAVALTPQLWHQACAAFDTNTSHPHQGVRLALECAVQHWNASRGSAGAVQRDTPEGGAG